MNPYYKDYAKYIAEFFPDFKVQKISVNSGASCPNRDGTIGTGGCAYCDNSSFTPGYCMQGGDIAAQICAGRKFFARKYPHMKFLAYFQSFTTTHGRDACRLSSMWEEALDQEDIVGLVVGTRPDCLPQEAVDSLRDVARRVPVFIELGAESAHDKTLRLVNRGHTWAQTVDAVRRCADAGLHVGLHMICGLPGESRRDILDSTIAACRLPVESLKFHHLQILKSTPLYDSWLRGDFPLLFDSAEEYARFCCELIEIIPQEIAIERFMASAPPAKVAAPAWGLKNYEFTNLLLNLLSVSK